jgi:hypothetical protein
LRTLRRFPLPSSVDEATKSLRIAIHLAGHAAKRARPQCEARNMADDIFDRCTVHGVKLSFTSQAQLGAHTQNASASASRALQPVARRAATGLIR